MRWLVGDKLQGSSRVRQLVLLFKTSFYRVQTAMGWDLRVPSSLTSDVSAAWHQMELAGSNLFRFESNLSSPYPGMCFTSRLVEFGGLIWSNLSESCRPAAAVTLKYVLLIPFMVGKPDFRFSRAEWDYSLNSITTLLCPSKG